MTGTKIKSNFGKNGTVPPTCKELICNNESQIDWRSGDITKTVRTLLASQHILLWCT